MGNPGRAALYLPAFFAAAQRFFVASIMRLRPSGLRRRFAFSAGAGVVSSALFAAHLFRCASAIGGAGPFGAVGRESTALSENIGSDSLGPKFSKLQFSDRLDREARAIYRDQRPPAKI
jgi:hypothetical protein